MSPLRLLWVNGEVSETREAWIAQFAARCDLVHINTSQFGAQDAQANWDLVCFNFDFPEMSGLRLIPDCKARWPSAPILLLTVQCSLDLAVWALRTRVFDLLVKPLSPQEIERCMQRVLDAVRSKRAQSQRRANAGIAPMPLELRYRPQLPPSSRLQLAIAHVKKHYARVVPESEVARVCEMSPSRFCREFKSAFGMTFVEYLSRHRIAEARRLLANRSIAITDVAAAVGFSDPSYFTRVFRKIVGTSPTQFREAPASDCPQPLERRSVRTAT